MRAPFITRSRHAREIAKARRQGRIAATADAQRDISHIWDTLQTLYGEARVREIQRAVYATQFYSVPVRYVTGCDPR